MRERKHPARTSLSYTAILEQRRDACWRDQAALNPVVDERHNARRICASQSTCEVFFTLAFFLGNWGCRNFLLLPKAPHNCGEVFLNPALISLGSVFRRNIVDRSRQNPPKHGVLSESASLPLVKNAGIDAEQDFDRVRRAKIRICQLQILEIWRPSYRIGLKSVHTCGEPRNYERE